MSTEIANKEFFTAENFRKINGEKYKPSDIRTYKMAPLCSTPFMDILTHLSIPCEGRRGGVSMRTNMGYFSGNCYEETHTKAGGLILHFPKASDVVTPKGLMKVDSLMVNSLFPSWMITRYGRANLSHRLTLRHTVNFFLDKKTKNFVYMFDESFLDDIDSKLIIKNVEKDSYHIYRGKEKGKRYLAITSKDFDELTDIGRNETAASKAFKTICQNYFALTMDAESLEKVIVITYKSNDCDFHNDHIFGALNKTKTKHKTDLALTFFKAARYEDTIYLIDENNVLNTRKSVRVVRDHAKDNGLLGQGLGSENRHESVLVIPYSDDDWARLCKLQEQLNEVQRALGEFFGHCQNEVGSLIDKALTEALPHLAKTKMLEVK